MNGDGDCRSLVPTWLINGIEIIHPLEVAAGMDPVEIRKAFPGIRMMGGFDKRVLFGDRDDIKKELLRLTPFVDEGGFVIHVDYSVPPDVSFENYCYFVRMKRKIYGSANTIWEQ
jgi:hypothetical protein